MQTLVVKFHDTLALSDLIQANPDCFAPVPWSYHGELKLAADDYGYALSYAPLTPELSDLMNVLRRRRLALRFLFSDTTPEQLTAVVRRVAELASDNRVAPRRGKYTYANLFNYFAVDCPDDQAADLHAAVFQFVLVNPADYRRRPLECAYLRAGLARPAVTLTWWRPWWDGFRLAPGPTNRPAPAPPMQATPPTIVHPLPVGWTAECAGTGVNEDVWETLGVRAFWQTLFQQNESFFNEMLGRMGDIAPWYPDVRIHDIEPAWDVPPSLERKVRLSGENNNVALRSGIPSHRIDGAYPWHGCCVLSLLLSPWPQAGSVPGPDTAGVVKGLAPQADVRLYSMMRSSGAPRYDDALALALHEARERPNDVILLECELRGMPRYDVVAGLNNYAPLSGSNFPMEVDQAMFDLIRIGTRGLGLAVVEPAGNGSLDLDAYELRLQPYAERFRQEISWPQRLDAFTRNPALREEILQLLNRQAPLAKARCFGYHPERDSGAILVGGAVRSGGSWENRYNHGNRLDTCGPGEGVLATYPDGRAGVFCKTSAAAALVAGLVATLNLLRQGQGRTRTDVLDPNPARIRAQLRNLFAQRPPWSVPDGLRPTNPNPRRFNLPNLLTLARNLNLLPPTRTAR